MHIGGFLEAGLVGARNTTIHNTKGINHTHCHRPRPGEQLGACLDLPLAYSLDVGQRKKVLRVSVADMGSRRPRSERSANLVTFTRAK